jgi:hypothetical protein
MGIRIGVLKQPLGRQLHTRLNGNRVGPIPEANQPSWQPYTRIDNYEHAKDATLHAHGPYLIKGGCTRVGVGVFAVTWIRTISNFITASCRLPFKQRSVGYVHAPLRCACLSHARP